MDSRGLSTVVEKTLAIGLVTLFLSLSAVTVFGGVLGDARTEAGSRIADRTVAVAAERVQQSLPPNGTRGEVRLGVDLPSTIRGANYQISVEDRTLVLDHPRDALDRRAPLAVPAEVAAVEGRWESGADTYVRVRRANGSLLIRLETGEHR
jgi:hypothetical protein